MSKPYELHPSGLYDFTAGVHCGVLITENVMRKLAKLQAKHMEDVKRLLSEEASRGHVFPSMWTLYYPDGKQTTVRYIDTSETVDSRIKSALTTHQPNYCKVVFVAGTMKEAEEMALARFAETGEV
ncbi:hypothetical protein [Massilia sp. TS11]|uniref:hypothetical protein n=1 Tax=Massilia sp. TS11 TaxID=2908003 RepID=UPI001EDAF2DE|nr:hypothetical protein [Massilia sp. TS11]MCG2586545.1 hypothetical protein [Massilia sp. TS11]